MSNIRYRERGVCCEPCGAFNHEISAIHKMSIQHPVSSVMIHEEEEGQKLDRFLLKQMPNVPKSHIYRIIRTGQVRVNKGRVPITYRLKTGDLVRVPPIRLIERDTPTDPDSTMLVDIPILFEDDAMIVLNKPFGIAVHGGSGINLGVIEQLRIQRQPIRFMELVHRLDRDTSGLLLVAKKRSALMGLHEVLRDGHAIDKRYLAMVSGVWPHGHKHIKDKLLKFEIPSGERRVKVSEEGLASHTIVHFRQHYDAFSLIECELKTGRTHQIRVHLAHHGHPILGDTKYGDLALNKMLSRIGLKRMFLHAWRIAFKHPLTSEPLQFEAPLPPELQSFLAQF